MFRFGKRFADRAAPQAAQPAVSSASDLKPQQGQIVTGVLYLNTYSRISVGRFGLTVNQPYVPVAAQLRRSGPVLDAEIGACDSSVAELFDALLTHTKCDTCGARRSNRSLSRVPTGLPAFD